TGQRQQEAVAAVVHVLLLQRVAHLIALGRASAAQRVVAAAGVGDDRQQRSPLARHQTGAGRQIDVALGADRLGRAVALVDVAAVEEQRIDSLVALEVDDAKGVARRELVRPALAGGQRDVDRRLPWIERALLHAEAHSRPPISTAYASVNAKPRPFSGRDRRQRSSAGAGGPSTSSSSTGGG